MKACLHIYQLSVIANLTIRKHLQFERACNKNSLNMHLNVIFEMCGIGLCN